MIAENAFGHITLVAIYPSCIEIPYFSQKIGTENQIFSTILISITVLKY